jgi:pimeloyl-ACP methyl ester carboxylesterase
MAQADMQRLLAYARRRGVEPVSPEPPERRSVSAGGLTLSYLDWGGPAAQPLLFLHGGALTAHTWDVVCLALRGAYRCLALDLRGHGESEHAADGDYRLDAFAGDVHAVLDALGLELPVLVGNSLGGQAALLAAAARADLGGVVLVDVGPSPGRTASARIVRAIDAPEEFATLDDVVRRAAVLNPAREPAALRDSLPNNLRTLPNGRLTWKYDWRAFAGLTDEVFEQRAELLWSALDRLRCPLLVVRGGDSDVLTDAQVEELRARHPSVETDVVADAGHTIQGDNPGGLVRAMQPVLERWTRAAMQ